MTADAPAPRADDAPAPPPKPKRRKAMDVLRELGRPKVAVMLLLGVSSGLPFMLIGNTLGFWLAESHIKLAAIGFLSWAGLAYLLKFVWGALVDRAGLPVLGSLGRRRGWMVLTQIVVMAGLVGMALSGPARLDLLAEFAVLAAFGAAMQDTVIDAWRIEIADDEDELGLLTAAYSLGFRIAMFATEALILLVATWIGWSLSYLIYGLAMAIGVAAALLAKEPARTVEHPETGKGAGPVAAAKGAVDAVVGPFIAFFRAHGFAAALLMLLFITAYHLSDYLRGPMVNPFYTALHIDKPTIAYVRGAIGVPFTIAGIALGGASSVRLGARLTLLIGALIQPVGIAAFALLAAHGGDYTLVQLGGLKLSAFAAIMAFDAFAIGYSGVALVGYMSSLTSVGYTATQYALLTSAMAWSGKSLKGFSGTMVEGLQKTGIGLVPAFGEFYLLAAALGLPAVILLLLMWRLPANRPA